MTVAVEVALLQRVVGPLAGDRLLQQSHIVGNVVRVGDVLEAHAQQLLTRIAHHVAEVLIHPQQGAIQADVGHAGRRLLECGHVLPVGLPRSLARLAQALILLLDERDGADDHQLGDQVPAVEPEGLHRVAKGQRKVRLDQEEIDDEHAQHRAEQTRRRAAIDSGQHHRERQRHKAAAGLGGGQHHPQPGRHQRDHHRHQQAHP